MRPNAVPLNSRQTELVQAQAEWLQGHDPERFGPEALELGNAIAAVLAELERLRNEYIAHRIAAAILVGAVTADYPDRVGWAAIHGSASQPERIGLATRQIVADVRRYDEGTAASLADDIRAALTDEGEKP